jgi:RHS repeat-associated protein
MVALSHTDANQDYTSMEYALLPNSDGNLYVFESGVNRGVVSTYTTADVFRVAVEGGVVKYRKNGILVYTSTVAPTYPLLADVGLYHNGGTLSNVVLKGNLGGTITENVSWTNVVGATAAGNSLTKTGSTAWGNSGASSIRSIVSGDGYVEFKVTSLLTGMVALSHTDANQDYTSMEFALLPNSDGNLYVFESGVNRGVVSSYTTADVFRVAVEGGVVKYRKNGTVVYISTVAPTYPLLADTGLYHNGGTFSNVAISGNLVGSTTTNINWLVTDHLGTPRMIVDQTGALANVKRRDYLPFGEELFAGVGARTTAQGYSLADGVRQQFTSKERDVETGLDYFSNRYYHSIPGRFMSADPIPMTSQRPSDPQRLNLYAYVRGNPLVNIDPNGLDLEVTGSEAKRYVDDLEKATKLKLKLDSKTGQVSIVKEGKTLSKEAQRIKTIIGDTHNTVHIEAIRDSAGTNQVVVGRFEGGGRQTLDYADIDKLGKQTGGTTPQSVVIHETTEAYEGLINPQSLSATSLFQQLKPAHTAAVEYENSYRRGQGLGERIDSNQVIVTQGNQTLVVIDYTTHIERFVVDNNTQQIKSVQVIKKQ